MLSVLAPVAPEDETIEALSLQADLVPAKQQQDPEKAQLKTWYFEKLFERHGINANIGLCATIQSAFLHHLERKTMQLPLNGEIITAMHPSILADYRNGRSPEQTLTAIWEQAKSAKESWENSVLELKKHWLDAKEHETEISDPDVRIRVEQVRSDLQPIVRAIVSDRRPGGSLQSWQHREKSFRASCYHTHRHYLRTLIAYYSMLLEVPAGADVDDTVLPNNIPETKALRAELSRIKDCLEIVHVSHQIFARAKSAHGNQPGHSVRRNGEPVMAHPRRLMDDVIFYGVPRMLEADEEERAVYLDQLKLELAAAAAHDVPEDSDVDLDRVVGKFGEMVNHTDTAIEGLVRSLYRTSARSFRAETLPFGHGLRQNLKRVLSYLDNNGALGDRHLNNIVRNNAGGAAVTERIMSNQGKVYRTANPDSLRTPNLQRVMLRTKVRRLQHRPGLSALRHSYWPPGDEGTRQRGIPRPKTVNYVAKMDAVPPRHEARAGVSARVTKMSDRRDNIRTRYNQEYSARSLRSTMPLLAYEIDRLGIKTDPQGGVTLDSPPSDALALLLIETLREYMAFKQEQSVLLREVGGDNRDYFWDEKYDDPNIEQLTIWANQVLPHVSVLPDFVGEISTSYLDRKRLLDTWPSAAINQITEPVERWLAEQRRESATSEMTETSLAISELGDELSPEQFTDLLGNAIKAAINPKNWLKFGGWVLRAIFRSGADGFDGKAT